MPYETFALRLARLGCHLIHIFFPLISHRDRRSPKRTSVAIETSPKCYTPLSFPSQPMDPAPTPAGDVTFRQIPRSQQTLWKVAASAHGWGWVSPSSWRDSWEPGSHADAPMTSLTLTGNEPRNAAAPQAGHTSCTTIDRCHPLWTFEPVFGCSPCDS